MPLLLPAVIVLVDQSIKAAVLHYMSPGAPIHLIEGLLALRLGFNRGLAFGLLAELDEAWRWVVWLLSLAALVVLARVARQIVPRTGALGRAAVALVFGGAVGNLIDRVRHGAVVDFIDVYWRTYHWPAFNAADAAITVGVMLLGWILTRDEATNDGSR